MWNKICEKIKNKSEGQLHKHVKREMVFLLALIILFVIVAVKNYTQRVEILSEKEVDAVKRTANKIELQWDANDKIEKYKVFYKRSGDQYNDWRKKTIDNSDDKKIITCKIKGLEEGTEYTVLIQTLNDINKKFKSGEMHFATKTNQKIVAVDDITKLTSSKKFTINAEAKTDIRYESDNTDIASINSKSGMVKIKKSGTVKLKLKAKENKYYTSAKKTIKLVILDIKIADKKGSAFHVAYNLTNKNCEVVKKIKGSGSVQVPQGLGYTGKKYIVAYGMSGAQRIITFDVKGKGKKVTVPKISLGHPNGFTYSKKTESCYSVRGWSSSCVVFNTKTGKFRKISIPYGCSGIAYDRKDDCFYTSSRTGMRKYTYEGKFKHEKLVGNVKHSGKVYTQDCGGHAGILFHCMSGNSKHGTNYIDLYDMRNGYYIGSLKCQLSEIESAIVDKEGYLEIMSNCSRKTDYIYKTPINIDDLAEEL